MLLAGASRALWRAKDVTLALAILQVAASYRGSRPGPTGLKQVAPSQMAIRPYLWGLRGEHGVSRGADRGHRISTPTQAPPVRYRGTLLQKRGIAYSRCLYPCEARLRAPRLRGQGASYLLKLFPIPPTTLVCEVKYRRYDP